MQGTSQSMLGSLIQAQIEKLQAEAKGTGFDDAIVHRSQLDEERNILLANNKSKSSSKSNGQLPSGLNPAVASIMRKHHSDSDSSSDSSSSDSDSDSDESSSDDSSHRKRKRKHSSKSSKSKKDHKKHKKSDDRRKDEKKRHKKKHKRKHSDREGEEDKKEKEREKESRKGRKHDQEYERRDRDSSRSRHSAAVVSTVFEATREDGEVVA